ncbi:MAG: proton-conducting transporter membrane subunit, partial [Candidatus Bipolaricaulota bacterium]|nr:proton-conducting transporter membrane subunit [Candidatus Bipolaricaulota bacterium]
KAGLFLSAGIVEQNAGTKDITKLGGLIRTMPWTAAAFLLCSFSVMGIPPFGGFFGKYMVLSAAVSANEIVFAAVFFVGALLTILYLFRLFTKVFLGEPKGTPAVEKSRLMVACVVLLAALSLIGGLAVGWPSELARVAISQMLGVTG